MKILVTGGAGFIGSHLVDALILKGEEVLIVDDLSTGKKEFINPKAIFYQGDIRDDKTQEEIKNFKPEVVFHLAAQKSVRDSLRKPSYDADINIIGILKLLETCFSTGIKKFVFASTGGAMYGEGVELPAKETELATPESPYGLAKLTSEKYLELLGKLNNLQYTVLRLSNVYGPRQDPYGEAGVVAIFCKRAIAKETLFVNGDGKQTRDYVYVQDVVRAFLAAIENGKNEVYNISTRKELSVLGIIELIKKNHSQDVLFEHKEPMPGEIIRSILDYQKAKDELGWEPQIIFEDGLSKTYQYFNDLIKQ
ncbi:MAG: NAD-dependent epimerase/dehydratase family protein [Patescibacteria group bacterium]|jgi:UDP-glucose 4-epimerase